MNLNKVLEKELDEKLVKGKCYLISKNNDFPDSEEMKLFFLYKKDSGYVFYCGDPHCFTLETFDAWYLAKVGIKEFIEPKTPTIKEVGDMINSSKKELKQNVLAEVDNLILGEKDYISQWSKSIYLDSSEGKVRSAIASLRNLESLKEKINAL